MATIKDFYQGARPKTLSAAVSPVFIGGALAFAAYKDHKVDIPVVFYIALAAALIVALALQVGVNYANDYSDGKKGTDDVRIGPMRLVGSGTATPKSVFIAMCISFAIAGLAGLFVAYKSSWWLVAVGAACIALAYLYTGTKFAYGYFGFGELVVFICFGLVATVGTYYALTHELTLYSVIASFISGMFSVAILLANNIRDIETDRESNKKTLPARVGKNAATAMFNFCILFIFIAILLIGLKYHWALLALLVSPFIGNLNRKINAAQTPKDYIDVLIATSKLNLISGALVAVTLVISAIAGN